MSRPRVVGLAEVAELLAVAKRTAQRYSERPDFPEPLDRLAAGPVWLRNDVERWAAEWMPLRVGRPRRKV